MQILLFAKTTGAEVELGEYCGDEASMNAQENTTLKYIFITHFHAC